MGGAKSIDMKKIIRKFVKILFRANDLAAEGNNFVAAAKLFL